MSRTTGTQSTFKPIQAWYQSRCKINFRLASWEVVSVKVQPLGDRLLVRPVKREERTKAGIVIPDTAKEKPQEGMVEAVGGGRVLEDGTKLPVELKVGDRVLYAKYAGNEFKLEGEEYLIVAEKDVLAVVEGAAEPVAAVAAAGL